MLNPKLKLSFQLEPQLRLRLQLSGSGKPAVSCGFDTERADDDDGDDDDDADDPAPTHLATRSQPPQLGAETQTKLREILQRIFIWSQNFLCLLFKFFSFLCVCFNWKIWTDLLSPSRGCLINWFHYGTSIIGFSLTSGATQVDFRCCCMEKCQNPNEFNSTWLRHFCIYLYFGISLFDLSGFQ